MLKPLSYHDGAVLFDLMQDPAIYPFVRYKSPTQDAFIFTIKQLLEEEEQGKSITRVIHDEKLHPIGMIHLYEVAHGAGFLSTWIGKPYFGQGYNRKAKDAFCSEVFSLKGIHTIFMRIKKDNIRSQKAALKLPYVERASDLYSHVTDAMTAAFGPVYDLFVITKENFYLSQGTAELFTGEHDQIEA